VALSEYENAVEDLTRSLTKNHSRGIAYLARGLAYAELGEETDAALDFNSAAAFSSAEVESFLKLFENHKSQLNKTMVMLKRESAPWKALLTNEEADKIKNWLS
jgi:tetratricopeptide (TPR) repeat protein